MADGFSSSEFNNILSDLEQDLDTQLEPALRDATQALQTLLQGARERIAEVSRGVLEALGRSRELGELMRAELETFERVHLQAAQATQEQLAGLPPALAEASASSADASAGLVETLDTLDAALPGFSEGVDGVAGRLAELVDEIAAQTRQRSEQADAEGESLGQSLATHAESAEQGLTTLAQACDELVALAQARADSHGSLCAEEVAQSAEQLRSGVRDAAQAAENAAGLVLEGLEVFSGASEQMKSLFGDQSDEVMGTVRRIAELIEAIRPFIDLAKSI